MAKIEKPTERLGEEKYLSIAPPNMKIVKFTLHGTSPLMVSAFTKKAIDKMKAVHEAGTVAKGKKIREKRDFESDFKEAFHRSTDGWAGMPAGAFRTAMVDACRLVGYAMTKAKLAVFIEKDGLDSVTQVPLVKITGEPRPWQNSIKPERNDDGSMDLRCRPVWETWSIEDFRVRFDADQFHIEDVANLLMRAGQQVGVGEGRPNSRNSTGIGFGLWDVDPGFTLIQPGKIATK